MSSWEETVGYKTIWVSDQPSNVPRRKDSYGNEYAIGDNPGWGGESEITGFCKYCGRPIYAGMASFCQKNKGHICEDGYV